MPDTPNIHNPTIQEQIIKSEQSLKSLRQAIVVAQKRLAEYAPKTPQYAGEIGAYQTMITKLHEHLQGIKKMHTEDQLSIDEYQTAVKWTREVLGIPESLVEGSKINLHRTEGAAFACRTVIEDLQGAIKAEEANIRRLETVGERVDDLDARKAEAAAAKADESPQPQPAQAAPVAPVATAPPSTG